MATREWWIARCLEIRSELGAMREFKSIYRNEYPIGQVGIVWISGPAVFDSGSAKVRLDWDLGSGRPKLFNLQVERGESIASIPGFTGTVFR
jgi:hypothetical protein